MYFNEHKVYSQLQFFFSEVSQKLSERRRQITIIWQSLPVLSKVLILIGWTITIPFTLALALSILLILVFSILNFFLFFRWLSMVTTADSVLNTVDMKVPTFFSTEKEGDEIAYVVCTPVVGIVFGWIHCVGWFFNFPSGDEALLWRVSSAVLTGLAFLLPIFLAYGGFYLLKILNCNTGSDRLLFFIAVFLSILLLLVYVVSRLLLLVEAFMSLRHLTPGMLALLRWSSFIPHI